MMVEDDRSICRLVELGYRGLVVRCAYDCPSGVSEAKTFRPDVAILDIMLPGMDGVGVLEGMCREGANTASTRAPSHSKPNQPA